MALLTFAGLEPQRLRLDWVSAAEGDRFAQVCTEFTEEVRALGPLHLETSLLPQAQEAGLEAQKVAL